MKASPLELSLKNTVVCIGNFDGVHLGHQALLTRMKTLATREGLPSVIITFQPPSRAVFTGIPYLTSAEEKLRLLNAFEPAAVVMVPFNLDYAKTDKETFLDELTHLRPEYIIVGEDFRFGYKRSGGLNDLSHVTKRLEVFGLQRLGDLPIKSTLIREYLSVGRVEEAARFLGHSYFAMGEVIEGAKRGRSIGFPTANLNLSPQKALPLGVFAVTVETPDGSFAGIANVGSRPSFPDEPPSLEVHLLDYKGDLYGKTILVAFESFLRGQKKFGGLEQLKAQLAQDEAEARARLAEKHHDSSGTR